MVSTSVQIQREVREIVFLLMKRPITEDVAMAVKSFDGFKHLLVENGNWLGLEYDGDEMTTGEEHGWIEALILHFLMAYVLLNKLGRVYPGDVTFVLDGEPGNIRKMREPDIALVIAEHVKPSKGFIYRAPDLAVEIQSPSQSYEEMVDKAAEYFDYGMKQVWIVLPDEKAIEVHQVGEKPHRYTLGQIVPGGDLLPGFSLDVAAVFEA